MSFSSNTSSSSSSPTVVPTPENNILDEIARYASQLAPQMMGWAQNVFSQTSQITNEAVNNFFNASQQMTGLAGNMINQYNTLFAPENAQLVADANSYASPARMAADMGMAGATQAQAGDQAIKNSEQNLLSYGIDPSAGRYASLDKAAAVQNAANVAGAENQQRMADINTGQQLRAEAVQTGSLLPSSISNAQNTAIQANAGASNASLANANTGANLMGLADRYLQTAMGLKLSPVGQNSRSNSFGQSSSPGRGGGNSGGGGGGRAGGGGFGGNGAGGPAWGMNNPNYGGAPGMFSLGGGTGGGVMADGQDTATGYIGDNGTFDTNYGLSDSTGLGNIQDSNPFQDSGFGQTYDPTGQGYTDQFGGQTDFNGGALYSDPNSSYLPDWANGGFGNSTYDSSANNGSFDTSGFGNYSQPSDTNWDSSAGNGSFQDYSNYTPDYSNSGNDSSYDTSGGYAGGGAIQPPGSPVPAAASPSGGAQTDDVNANLNAGEFVVPKDVSKWKGEEFFHKLIADSRNKRAQMAASLGTGPKPAMRPPGPTTFSTTGAR